jgi:hypothetical protein
MAQATGLSGRPRRRLQAQVRAEEPNCHLCGLPIDLTLDPMIHPLSSCVDEITPRSQGGDPLDRNNTRHAHRICNEYRATHPITPTIRAACRTQVEALIGQQHSRRW